MTPAEIEVALWYYYSPCPYPRQQPLYGEIVAKFIAAGLLVEPGPINEHGSMYSGTPRLKAYCESLQAVPLPESQWVTRWPENER